MFHVVQPFSSVLIIKLWFTIRWVELFLPSGFVSANVHSVCISVSPCLFIWLIHVLLTLSLDDVSIFLITLLLDVLRSLPEKGIGEGPTVNWTLIVNRTFYESSLNKHTTRRICVVQTPGERLDHLQLDWIPRDRRK